MSSPIAEVTLVLTNNADTFNCEDVATFGTMSDAMAFARTVLDDARAMGFHYRAVVMYADGDCDMVVWG